VKSKQSKRKWSIEQQQEEDEAASSQIIIAAFALPRSATGCSQNTHIRTFPDVSHTHSLLLYPSSSPKPGRSTSSQKQPSSTSSPPHPSYPTLRPDPSSLLPSLPPSLPRPATTMARNEEKAQAMLNKWLTMKKDLATGTEGGREGGREEGGRVGLTMRA